MSFKHFAIGLTLYILVIVFIVFASQSFVAKPKDNCRYPSYQQAPTPVIQSGSSNPTFYDQSNSNSNNSEANYQAQQNVYNDCQAKYTLDLKKYDQSSFVVIVILSVLSIVAGTLVMSVAAISWGLIGAGLSTLLYTMGSNFDVIDKTYMALISGIALVVLIWIGYAKLKDEEISAENKPLTVPPSTPMPPNNTIA